MARDGYEQYLVSNPNVAAKFQTLEAEAAEWRGFYEEAIRVLDAPATTFETDQAKVEKKAIEAVAFTHLQKFNLARQQLMEADDLCGRDDLAACGDVNQAHGLLAMEQGKLFDARKFFMKTLEYARKLSNRSLESTTLLNISAISLQQDRYDEALDWSSAAQVIAGELGNKNLEEAAIGNCGWAYFSLGDNDRALDLFLDAEKKAVEVGNVRNQLKWLVTTGNTYTKTGNADKAASYYRQALKLARLINSRQDIVNSLEELTNAALTLGRTDDAEAYINQLTPLVAASGNHLDELDVMLAQAKIAAERHQDAEAKDIFHAVENDPTSQTSMRLGAEHELALLFEQEGDAKGAEAMYRTALKTFESARKELRNEDSKLPFLTNAGPIYNDYLHFLVAQGRTNDALAEADRSRALTLAQGLDEDSGKAPVHTAQMRPNRIARKAGATLLFYWLAPKESYLWAIGPQKTDFRILPPQKQIEAAAERYRKAVVSPIDPLSSANEDGRTLYNMLVAPVVASVPTGSKVVILADGALNLLNFETLLVPGPSPHAKPRAANPDLHYWIEDATVVSAPSLAMLAAARPSAIRGGKLLLLGDAVSPSREYPPLNSAPLEIEQIERHFKPGERTVIAREKATPAAYLNGNPGQYSYIHFVTHGTASRTDPLDSAIILSRASDAEDSFKLHAREIIHRRIDAELVTISACYGGGSRAFAGEGLVGLSWGFMRAGAHNVIGALWEASDDSSPQLMNDLYQGLEEGRSPGDALHAAKLALVHSPGSFSRPYYWASFQLYTGR